MSDRRPQRSTPPRLVVEALAATQNGVVSLRQSYAAGLSRGAVRADVRAGRWRRVGRQCLAVHNGPLDSSALLWVAVLDAGPRACLDGASSLVAAGLTNFDHERIRVSVPRGAKVVHSASVDVRQTRRWHRDDLVPSGIPRTRNEVAAVRGGLWARSDKQASLVVVMAVQQRLTTPAELASAMMRIRRDRRRMLLNEVILEIAGGVESLGELDVARECRARGLPEPSRQVKRQGVENRWFLDVYWERFGVVVEVDGIHHAWVQNVVPDAIRHNELAIRGDVVLRLPLLGLRFQPNEFFAQVEAALRQRGWSPSRVA